MAQINVALQLLPIFLERDFLSYPVVAHEDPTSDCLVHDDVQRVKEKETSSVLPNMKERKASCFLFFFFTLVKRLPYKQNLSP